MWASIRGRTAGHVRNLHAAFMGDPHHNELGIVLSLRICSADSVRNRADGGDIKGGGSVRSLHDPAAVRVRGELSDSKVPAVAEQDHGDGSDRGGGADHTHSVELAADAEARLGAGGCGGGAEPVVVDHSAGADGLYCVRDLRPGVDWLLLEGLP